MIIVIIIFSRSLKLPTSKSQMHCSHTVDCDKVIEMIWLIGETDKPRNPNKNITIIIFSIVIKIGITGSFKNSMCDSR